MRYSGSGRLARKIFFAVLLASLQLCYAKGTSPVTDPRIGIVNADGLVAAHRTYPVGTYLKVANAENGMEILVKVICKTNDLAKDEVVISAKAARQLGLSVGSPAQVTICVNGQTDRKLATIVFPTEETEIAENTPSGQNDGTSAKEEPAPAVRQDTQTGSNVATTDKADIVMQEPKAIDDTVITEKDEITVQATVTNAAPDKTTNTTGDTKEGIKSTSDTLKATAKPAVPNDSRLKSTTQTPAPIAGSSSSTEKRWRIYLGAFGVGENAERFATRLRKDGFNPSIEKSSSYTFVMIANVQDKDLRTLRSSLNSAGYSDQNIQQYSVGVTPSEPREGDIPTKIMGKGRADVATLLRFLKAYNATVEAKYAESVIAAIIDESDAEGVNHDIAFVQMCQTTNFLRFGGLLTKNMNNFGGIGAVSKDNPGEYFDSIQEGVRAQVQHLKVYASREPLKKKLVDPRNDRIVAAGLQASAEDIYGLTNKWAADPKYGDKLFTLLVELYKTL
jgi:cell division protein FtsN